MPYEFYIKADVTAEAVYYYIFIRVRVRVP